MKSSMQTYLLVDIIHGRVFLVLDFVLQGVQTLDLVLSSGEQLSLGLNIHGERFQAIVAGCELVRRGWKGRLTF